MKRGTKVLTPEGQLATVVKSKNGVYVVWVFVTLDIDKGKGRIYQYVKTSLKQPLNIEQ